MEQLGDIYIVLRTSLHVPNAVFFGQLLAFFLCNQPFRRRTIRFVTHDDTTDILAVMLTDLLQPVLDIREGLAISDRIHQDDSCCTLVVCFGDSLESLLSSCIPYLHLDLGAVTVDSLDLEINTDRGDMRHFVFFIDES